MGNSQRFASKNIMDITKKINLTTFNNVRKNVKKTFIIVTNLFFIIHICIYILMLQ